MQAHSNGQWHLDEVFVKINDESRCLWRAVDDGGENLESQVHATRGQPRLVRICPAASPSPPGVSGQGFAGFQGSRDGAVVEVIELSADGHALREGRQPHLAFEQIGDVMGGGLPVNSGIERQDHF